VILAAALLEILSVIPSQQSVHTDETFTFTIRVRNAGPDAAGDVKLRAGANAEALVRSIEGPPEWTCDAAGPRFTSVTTCTAPSLAAGAEAAFTVTLAAPQPSAMTYRVGAALSAKGVSAKRLEANMILIPADVNAELSMSAKKLDEERAAFEVHNAGPDEAKDVLVVITGAALASGDGWTCEPAAHGVVCTRATLPAKTASMLEARGAASAKMNARVRAEQIHDMQSRDDGAKPQ
jgi:Domain of unknown function DUF11